MKALYTLMSLALCTALLPAPASAQYPNGPVRLIVPFPAGGPSDTVARTVGQALTKSIGQQLVIENKAGADGAIAAQAVAGAPADGYTLLYGSSSMLALPFAVKPAPFDALSDFAPISTLGWFAYGMYVYPGVPSKSMADFIAHARSNPGRLNFASVNLTEYMAAWRFMKASGVNMVRVPYKGGPAAMPDLIAGRVQVYFGPLAPALPHVKAGRLHMLAILDSRRSAMAPDVPTMAEAGIADLSVKAYQMILAPAKTPREILDRLSRETNVVLQDAEVRSQIEKVGLFIEGSTPQAHAAMLEEATRAWAQFIRENKLAPE